MSGSTSPGEHARRLRQGVKQVVAAQCCGISERELRRLEKGERYPHPATREAFLHTYGEDPWAPTISRSCGAYGEGVDRQRAVERGRSLRNRRLELGLTQRDMARRGRERASAIWTDMRRSTPPIKLGHGFTTLSPQTVSRYERGVSEGRWESALAICFALDLDYDHYFPGRWRPAELIAASEGLWRW